MDDKELLLKWFRPPAGYGHDEEWDKYLTHCVESFGCDWLEWFQHKYNPWSAQSIIEMARRLESSHD